MIYVVKCFYCEHEFKVKRGETGADMMCPECGKANSIRDVIERIEEKKKVDPDLAAIKDFDISMNPVADDYWDEGKRRRERRFEINILATAVIIVALLIMRFLEFINVI